MNQELKNDLLIVFFKNRCAALKLHNLHSVRHPTSPNFSQEFRFLWLELVASPIFHPIQPIRANFFSTELGSRKCTRPGDDVHFEYAAPETWILNM